jgi:hypothetical protein
MRHMYRKTAFVEAYRFPFDDSVPQEFKDAVKGPSDVPPVYYIYTLEGNMEVTDGSWVCKGHEGEFWAIKESIFTATYEKVSKENILRSEVERLES